MEALNIGGSLAKDICFNSEFKAMHNNLSTEEFYTMYDNMRAILQTACLVHDIGNPPFGHFGELAICDYFKRYFKAHENVLDTYANWGIDFIQFDGNAQGFRALTKLQLLDNLYGLNLTKSTLAAYVKYPNAGPIDKNENANISQHKHGIFKADEKYLNEIRYTVQGHTQGYNARHPFTYLVEAADSICYLTMDIEDAINKEWITLENIVIYWEEFKSEQQLSNPEASIDELIKNLPNEHPIDRKKAIDLRVGLIKYLVELAVKNYIQHYEKILHGEYNHELIEDDNTTCVAEFLKGLCKRYIFSQKEIQSIELTGWSVINGLLDIYIKLFMGTDTQCQQRGETMISKSILRANKLDYLIEQEEIKWENKHYVDKKSGSEIQNIDKTCDKLSINDLPNYYRLRIIVDFISGMTDKFAVKHYQKLSGQHI